MLIGGGGDDWLLGGLGADTYRFSRGDGHETISDESTSAGDRLELTDLLSSEVSVGRLYKGSETVVLTFASGDDSITVRNALSDNDRGIEEIAFADGVIWTPADTSCALLDNNKPVAVKDGIFSVKQEENLIIDAATLTRNDFDADGEAVSIIAVDGGNDGTAQIDANGNIILYRKRRLHRRNPVFLYDYGWAQRSGYYHGRHSRNSASLSPKTTMAFSVDEDGFLSIEVERLLSNDVDGDRLIVAQVFNAQNGAMSALPAMGRSAFTPTADFNGLASFRYLANTPEGGSTEATVYIDVLPVNDAPVAVR